MSATPFDLSQTDRLLTTTRSVRKRLDFSRAVDRQIVLDCLGVATQAPTGGNSQPWRWLVVDDTRVKAQIGELYKKAHDPYMAANRRHQLSGILPVCCLTHQRPVLAITHIANDCFV